ncbi:MAG: ribbon-helix-helix domain-containing protein [Bdellovibrionales bacterium]
MNKILNSKLNEIDRHVTSNDDVKTTLLSRNITVSGRRTSVRLEPEMWKSLFDIAKRENCTIHDICTLISLRKNSKTSLTAAIRVFLMLYYRAAATEDGHVNAGHGNFEHMKSRAGLNDATMRKPKHIVIHEHAHA